MLLSLIEHDGLPVAECSGTIPAHGAAMDLVAACLEQGTHRLLLEARHLPPAFFELRSGFAGELVQKMQNYRIRVAGVFPSEASYGDRFREFLLEARRGHGFRVFAARDEALTWLAGE
jgi:hypothetical protein